jgi:hypothetical protein
LALMVAVPRGPAHSAPSKIASRKFFNETE